MMCVMALYSASTLDLTKTVCFLLFQVIKFPPKKVQYPLVDFQSNDDPVQLASIKAFASR